MKKIWVLVHVYHGIIQTPEFFKNKKEALKRKKEIQLDFNKDYDEIDLFLKFL
jgi:hypothetical protein